MASDGLAVSCQPLRSHVWKFLSKMDLNTLRLRQNGRHFTDDIFKCISVNENVRISVKISLNFVPKVRINNIPALVQIMAWCQPGDKPLSEPVMVKLLTHPDFEISNWMHLSIGQVDCKNHLSKCTIHLSEIYKANATYVKIRNTQSSVGQVLQVFHLSDCHFYLSQTIRRV